jgi:hypothetical protein
MAGFLDFSSIRSNWKNLSGSQRDIFLSEVAISLVPERIELLPVNRPAPSVWSNIKVIVSDYPEVKYLYVGGLLMLAWIALAIYLLIFSPLSLIYGLTILILGIAVIYKVSHIFNRHGVYRAASSHALAFIRLWHARAFAISIQGRDGSYDCVAFPNRWQDVVLLAMGWSELREHEIKTREQHVGDLLDSFQKDKATSNKNP